MHVYMYTIYTARKQAHCMYMDAHDTHIRKNKHYKYRYAHTTHTTLFMHRFVKHSEY